MSDVSQEGTSAASPQPPPGGAGGATGTAGAPAGGHAASFAFDVARWSREDRICGVATLVLFISLFLPWFSYNLGFLSVSVDGLWHGWTYLVLLLSLAVMAYLVAKAGVEELPTPPLSYAQLLMIATTANLVLVVLGFLVRPGGGHGWGWDFGAFVALAAAVVAWVPVGLPFVRGHR